jgi:hypothetical protein
MQMAFLVRGPWGESEVSGHHCQVFASEESKEI